MKSCVHTLKNAPILIQPRRNVLSAQISNFKISYLSTYSFIERENCVFLSERSILWPYRPLLRMFKIVYGFESCKFWASQRRCEQCRQLWMCIEKLQNSIFGGEILGFRDSNFLGFAKFRLEISEMLSGLKSCTKNLFGSCALDSIPLMSWAKVEVHFPPSGPGLATICLGLKMS